MNQITGRQEMRFLAQADGDAAKLAELAIGLGVLDAGADPTIAEWESCLLDVHRAASGLRVHAELTCPGCGEGVALIFGVDDLPRDTDQKPPEFEGKTTRPLRLSHLKAAEALTDAPGRLRLLLAEATGRTEKWAADILASDKASEAVSTLEKALTGLDVQLATSCTECGAEIVQPFDIQRFVSEARMADARKLLDEVHMIARAYHWSEADILDLPRQRRLSYLDRIERDILQIEVQDVRR